MKWYHWLLLGLLLSIKGDLKGLDPNPDTVDRILGAAFSLVAICCFVAAFIDARRIKASGRHLFDFS